MVDLTLPSPTTTRPPHRRRVRRGARTLVGVLVAGAPLVPAGPSVRAGATEARLVERECDTSPSLEPMRCYWLEVPERRDRPGARTIRLWVAVEGDADGDGSPVVHIAGGPGETSSAGWVAGSIVAPLVPGHLAVTMDSRGVSRSEPWLACPEFDSPLPTTAPRPARAAQGRLLQAQCRDLLEADGFDLDGYDSIEMAADYVDLRRALGVDQWVLLAGSYGGRLAREIFRQDPDGVEAMVLFSPLTTAPAGPASIIERSDDAVDRVVAACEAQPSCVAHGDFRQNVVRAAANLEANPFELDDGIVVDGGGIYSALIGALRETSLIPILPVAAEQLANGDTSIIPAMAEALLAEPDDPRDAVTFGVFNVVNCADEGAVLTEADRLALEDPGVWEEVVVADSWACDVWDVEPVDGGRLQAVSGDIPVLIISGGLDPSTPPENADEVIEGFPNSTSVVIPAGGHSAGYGNECTRQLTVTFILDPSAELDTSCIDELPARLLRAE